MRTSRTHPMARWSAALTLLCALVFTLACGSTETGNPPLFPEPGFSLPDLAVVLPADVPGQPPNPVLLEGALANDVPPGSTVVVISLDLLSAARVTTELDDSDDFSVELPQGSNIWRVQVIAPDGSRYSPLDFNPTDGADPLFAPPAASCLSIPNAVATAGSPRVAEFEITNECLDAIDIQAPLARLNLAQVTPDGPLRLAPGESVSLSVELDAAVPIGGEELIVWDGSDGLLQYTTVFDPSER